METKIDSKLSGSTVAIIGAIITAIAGIITTIVTISAPIIDKRLAIEATQTKEAFVIETTRVAGIAIQPEVTPTPVTLAMVTDDSSQAEQSILSATQGTAPTQTKQPIPTAAPAFTPTPAIAENSAPSETMLKVGENWDVGNGIIVQLTDMEYPSANEVHIKFAFTNTSKRVIKVTLAHNRDVKLTDDKANVYKWASEFTWEVNIQPGTTRKDEVKRRGDVSLAKYFIVKLELPGIGSAQWKE